MAGRPTHIMKPRLLTMATILAIFWYLISCVHHLFSLRPLWNDEACVLISLKMYSSGDFFTKVLQAYQVFPRAYLFLIHKISQPFHFHLVSLRLIPFLAMMGAFLVWLKMASDDFKNKVTLLTFVLCWSASAVLIYYAAELKQYSMDVLVAALFVLFLSRQEKWEAKPRGLKYFLVLIMLPALILLSYTAYFFVLFPLYNLLLSSKERKGKLKFLAGYAGSLVIFSLLSYHFDMRLRSIDAVTLGFHDYFISFDSFPEFLRTLTEGTHNLFSRWFVERPKILKCIGLFFTTLGFLRMFYGFSKNFRHSRYRFKQIDTLALIVFMELILAGALKKYPFIIPRTSLFFCPIVFWLTVKAIEDLRNWNGLLYRLVGGSFIYFLVFVSLGISFFVFAGVLSFRPALW